MTKRDRLGLMGVVVFALLIVAWVMIVSPERKKAHEAAAAVETARQKLSSAHGQLGAARKAQKKYAASYSTIVSLGKAVPTSEEVPSLIYELAQASKQKKVQFASITSASAANGGSSSSGSSSGAPAAGGGFTQMPFTFVFNGSYFGLEHMLHSLSGFATRRTSGSLKINGRLLTIQSVKLAPVSATEAKPGSHGQQQLSATVTATAYAMPPQTAQSSSEAGAAPAANGSGSPSSPTPAAVVGAKP